MHLIAYQGLNDLWLMHIQMIMHVCGQAGTTHKSQATPDIHQTW